MLQRLEEVALKMGISFVYGELRPYEVPGDEQYYDPDSVKNFYISRGFRIEICPYSGKEIITKQLF